VKRKKATATARAKKKTGARTPAKKASTRRAAGPARAATDKYSQPGAPWWKAYL
jgi:hypothetical protein